MAINIPIEEEKLNSIKRLSNMNSLISKLIKKEGDIKLEDMSGLVDEKTNKVVENYQDIFINSCNLNSRTNKLNTGVFSLHENDYLRSVTDKFKTEISTLKSYIDRVNKEIRKSMKIEIPAIELSCSENKVNDMEEFIKFFNESVQRLINPDYLNPIFTIYENHILNLENEIKVYKSNCNKYENTIVSLVKENGHLRENLQIKQNELKEVLKFKIENRESSSPLDYDFIKSLEDRLLLLSRENEILALNFQKVSKELFDFSCEYSEKHKECQEKIIYFDNLNSRLDKVTTRLESEIIKNGLNEVKICDLSQIISKLEIEKEKIKLECEKFRSENESLFEANSFYKAHLQKYNK